MRSRSTIRKRYHMERKRRPCTDRKKEIFAVGDEAYEMYEKAPSTIEVVFPMRDGVISRFTDMQFLLQSLLKKDRQFVRGSEYVIAVPTDVTEVEKKAFLIW